MTIWIFPYGTIQFIAFEHDGTFTTTKLSFWSVHRLMAGSVAGLTAVICTYPLCVAPNTPSERGTYLYRNFMLPKQSEQRKVISWHFTEAWYLLYWEWLHRYVFGCLLACLLSWTCLASDIIHAREIHQLRPYCPGTFQCQFQVFKIIV